MDRAFQSGAAGSAPTAPASPSIGYPTAGNPGTGTPATKPGPYWYHMIMEELMAVIAAAGITPAQGNLTQLLTALRSAGIFQTQASGDQTTKAATTAFVNPGHSLAANGYTKLPNGVILQWGEGSTNASGQLPITFPVAFVDSGMAYRIVAMHSGPGPAVCTERFDQRSLTGTRIDVFISNTGAAATNGLIVRWFAIGR